MNITSFFIVWNPVGKNPQKRHRQCEEAKSEAIQLAIENPGKEFFVLELVGRMQRPVQSDWTPAISTTPINPIKVGPKPWKS